MINVDHAGVGNGRLTVGLTDLSKEAAMKAGKAAGRSDKLDLFGFFPGIGGVSRIRHSISPAISWNYSPSATIPEDYARARGGASGPAALTSPASQQLTVQLNQNFEGKGRPEPGDTLGTNTRKFRILSINTSGMTYDFEQAKLEGRTGWATEAVTNSFLSDLLPGFNLSLTHDLWDGPLGTEEAEFDPFLQSVSASFSLSGNTFRSLLSVFGLRYFQTYLLNRSGQRAMHDLRVQVFTHLQGQSLSFYNRNPVGRLMTRLTNDVEALNEMLTSGVVAILSDFVTLLAIALSTYAGMRRALRQQLDRSLHTTFELQSLALAEGGRRVTRIRVRLGALSHFTPEHFREHFEDAARGTLAEGAEVVRWDYSEAAWTGPPPFGCELWSSRLPPSRRTGSPAARWTCPRACTWRHPQTKSSLRPFVPWRRDSGDFEPG